MKYRTIPLEIDAVQFTDTMSVDDAPAWFLEALLKSPDAFGAVYRSGNTLEVNRPMDRRRAKLGDWVIYDDDGDINICSEDLFADAFVAVPIPATAA